LSGEPHVRDQEQVLPEQPCDAFRDYLGHLYFQPLLFIFAGNIKEVPEESHHEGVKRESQRKGKDKRKREKTTATSLISAIEDHSR